MKKKEGFTSLVLVSLRKRIEMYVNEWKSNICHFGIDLIKFLSFLSFKSKRNHTKIEGSNPR